MSITASQLGNLIYDNTVTNKPYLPTDTPDEILQKVWTAVSEPLIDTFVQTDQGSGIQIQNSSASVGLAGTVNFTGAGVTSVVNNSGTVTVTIAGSGGGISVTTGNIVDGAVTLAKMANLSQDQFIGRTTASTGVPETATITAAARTVLDDSTVSAMVDTLGGGSATGTGVLVKASSPILTTPNIGNATGNITGNAGTVTTNANLTGPITSIGNATTIQNSSVTLGNITGLGTLATQNGTFSGTSSGTNTGDQTIVLTTDLSGTGTGTISATVATGAITLAKMANLAQDQFIGRVTTSTGVPETATITAAARTVLDDTSVSNMIDTLGGGAATGTGVLVRASSPVFTTPNIGNATGNISGNAATVTTNANLTGPVTSVGNATAIGNSSVTLGNITGLGTLATQNGTFSGTSSGTNTGDQTITLTGDVTGTGTGSFSATITSSAVTNAKLAQAPPHTIKGNNTASTASVLDLTVTQVTAELNAMVGDSGSGGTKGLVPAPAAGDATAGKFLKADGNWTAPGNVFGPASATDNAIARFDLTTGKIIQNSIPVIDDTTGTLTTTGALVATGGTLTNTTAVQGSGAGTGAGGSFTGGATGAGIVGIGGATSGAGVTGTGTAGNSRGGTFAGQGSAAGAQGTGGTTGSGLVGIGGATSGDGVVGNGGAGGGSGVSGTAMGGNGNGGYFTGQGSGNGTVSFGGATGNGIVSYGGATSGSGGTFLGTGGNSQGIIATGHGSASGIESTGGASAGNGGYFTGGTGGNGVVGIGTTTGNGVVGIGGATSGDGVTGTGTAGNANGGSFTGVGSGSGILATGASTGFGASVVNLAGFALNITPDTTSPVQAAVRWTPQDTQPTGAHVVGDMYVLTNGTLNVCTAAGTPGTWQQVGRKGTSTNDSAAVGYVGEYISARVASNAAVSMTINVVRDIASIQLTAGDWDVSGGVYLKGATNTAYQTGWISSTSGTEPTGVFGDNEFIGVTNSSNETTLVIPPYRQSLSSSVTFYLSQKAGATGTLTGAGRISARRVR